MKVGDRVQGWPNSVFGIVVDVYTHPEHPHVKVRGGPCALVKWDDDGEGVHALHCLKVVGTTTPPEPSEGPYPPWYDPEAVRKILKV